MNQPMQSAMKKMYAPGQLRPKKATKGVIQILVTRACTLSCFNCTQGSNLKGPYDFMPLDKFEEAVVSLKDYPWVVGIFGGNPAVHKEFESLCEILKKHIPRKRRGLWCNDPINESKTKIMRETFNPAVSNLNVHLDPKAYGLFKKYWPESRPFGLNEDSRHSPVFGNARKVVDSEEELWEKVSQCEVNHRWSAGIGMFRGELRAWFCEIAMSQSIINQHNPDYPDTGMEVTEEWWKKPMEDFSNQIENHCPMCLVPHKGYGSLAQENDEEGVETTTSEYGDTCLPKNPDRKVQFVESKEDLHSKGLSFVNYLGGAKK